MALYDDSAKSAIFTITDLSSGVTHIQFTSDGDKLLVGYRKVRTLTRTILNLAIHNYCIKLQHLKKCAIFSFVSALQITYKTLLI